MAGECLVAKAAEGKEGVKEAEGAGKVVDCSIYSYDTDSKLRPSQTSNGATTPCRRTTRRRSNE